MPFTSMKPVNGLCKSSKLRICMRIPIGTLRQVSWTTGNYNLSSIFLQCVRGSIQGSIGMIVLREHETFPPCRGSLPAHCKVSKCMQLFIDVEAAYLYTVQLCPCKHARITLVWCVGSGVEDGPVWSTSDRPKDTDWSFPTGPVVSWCSKPVRSGL